MAKIQLRRGTRAALTSISPLLAGELFYCTDTDELYIGNGTSDRIVSNPIYETITNRPAAGEEGRLFVSTDTNVIYFDTGSAWLTVGAYHISSLDGDLDDIDNGTTYGKIKNAYIGDTGAPDAIQSGAYPNTLAGSTIQAHVNDDGKHREISDSSAGTTDLWSAAKISSEIASAISGYYWKEPIDSRCITEPTSPEVGDRHIVLPDATGTNWASGAHTNDIAEWTEPSGWDYYNPTEGDTVINKQSDTSYTYTESGWEATSGPIQVTITAGDGLTGGGTGSVLTIDVNPGLGLEIASDLLRVKYKADSGIIVDSNGVYVGVNGTEIVFDGSGKLSIGTIDCGEVT